MFEFNQETYNKIALWSFVLILVFITFYIMKEVIYINTVKKQQRIRQEIINMYQGKIEPELLGMLNNSLMTRQDLHKLKKGVEKYIPWNGDQSAAYQAMFITANPDRDIVDIMNQLPYINKEVNQQTQAVETERKAPPEIRADMEAFYGRQKKQAAPQEQKQESGQMELEQ